MKVHILVTAGEYRAFLDEKTAGVFVRANGEGDVISLDVEDAGADALYDLAGEAEFAEHAALRAEIANRPVHVMDNLSRELTCGAPRTSGTQYAVWSMDPKVFGETHRARVTCPQCRANWGLGA